MSFGKAHWEKMRWMVIQVKEAPRPVNSTKIYGSGYSSWGLGGPEDGVERFCRSIIGCCASSPFHRARAETAVNTLAKASIKAARKLETMIKLWDVTPQIHLLSDRDDNEAYLRAREGEQYAFYFPDGGSTSVQPDGKVMPRSPVG